MSDLTVSGRAPDGTAYELNGPEGGARVVLIHGLGIWRRMWDGHVARLAKRYRVLSYDLYGHGESAAPPETPSLSVYARQLRDLLDHVGWDRAHIVGFSLGGMINRRFAMDFGARALSLIIIASPHERGDAAQALVEQRARDSAEGPAATLDAAIERWYTPGFRAANPDHIAQIRAWVLANEPANFAACRWVLAHGVRELIRPDPPISHPTLTITAEHDSGSTPAMARAIAGEIAGARVVIVPGLQHMGLAEDVAAFTDPVIDFLEGIK